MFDLNQHRHRISKLDFPFINSDHEYRAIYVELRGKAGEDRWAITDGFGRCYQPRGGRWAYERRPSARTEKFLKASRMTLEEAVPIAERLSRSLASQWQRRLARMIARQEARAREQAMHAQTPDGEHGD